MKILAVILVLSLTTLVGCASQQPTTKDYLALCRNACRFGVNHYSDNEIDCICK